MEEENTMSAEDIQFAVFDGEKEITGEMYDEVKKFAAHIKQREGHGK